VRQVVNGGSSTKFGIESIRGRIAPPEGASGSSGKKRVVTELNGVFKASSVVIVAHYAGLTVAECRSCVCR